MDILVNTAKIPADKLFSLWNMGKKKSYFLSFFKLPSSSISEMILLLSSTENIRKKDSEEIVVCYIHFLFFPSLEVENLGVFWVKGNV